MSDPAKIVCVCFHIIRKELDWKGIQNTLLCFPFFSVMLMSLLLELEMKKL